MRCAVLCLHLGLFACRAPRSLASNTEQGDSRTSQDGAHIGVTFDNGSAQTHFVLDVANTPQTREKGLMYRRHLAANEGMLFAFAGSEPRTFWMKNTFIPLDLIFLDAQKRVVGIIAQARPLSEKPLGVEQASRYVVELAGGVAQRAGIAVGAQAIFLDPPPS